ncbi:epididymal-specific lipocalin-8 [Sapajus apella]|uniref:Epididymal-specific lipocalin-8 n=1 Tax=Sapajus apella TaxID=9515 RepID=A0A6J3GIJ3_SAPAP|nr:epididymal-specific lipocalin-8 [Sapajus apella]
MRLCRSRSLSSSQAAGTVPGERTACLRPHIITPGCGAQELRGAAMETRLSCTDLGALVVLWAQVAAAMVDLNRQKIGGFWREVGVASDRSLVLTPRNRVEGLFLTWNRSNLTVKVAYNSSGSCEIDRVVGSEIDTTGKFTFPGHREIHVLDTDYEGYAILRVSLMWRGRNFHVLKYFTRSLEDEERLGFRSFRELTADTGLYLAARAGRCAKLLKEELI